MSKFSKYKHFVVGCVVGSMLVSGVAVASNGALSNVLKGTSKFIINQVDKTPANDVFFNGSKNVPSSLVYEGTTYIPIRMVSNMLNVPIQWDGKNKAVLVGTSVYEGTYLTDIAPSLMNQGAYINNTDLDLALESQKYSNTLALHGFNKNTSAINYNLNAQYSTLTFLLGTPKDDNVRGTLTFYDENDNVLFATVMASGVKPQDVAIDVSGVMELIIRYTDESGAYNSKDHFVVIANPLLKEDK